MRERQKLEAIVDGVSPFPENVKEFVDLLNAVHDKTLHRRLLVKAVLMRYQPAIDVFAQGGLVVNSEITSEVERERRKLEELERRKQMLAARRRKIEESQRQNRDPELQTNGESTSPQTTNLDSSKSAHLESKKTGETTLGKSTVSDVLYQNEDMNSGVRNVFEVDLDVASTSPEGATAAASILSPGKNTSSRTNRIVRIPSDRQAMIVILLCVVILLQIVTLIVMPCLHYSSHSGAQSSYHQSALADHKVQTSGEGEDDTEIDIGMSQKTTEKTNRSPSSQEWIVDKNNMSPESIRTDQEAYTKCVQSGIIDEMGNSHRILAGIPLEEMTYDENALYDVAMKVMKKSVSLYLEQPGSARYPQTVKSHDRSNHLIELSGPVDSYNKFGSVGRKRFSVMVQYNSAGMWTVACTVY